MQFHTASRSILAALLAIFAAVAQADEPSCAVPSSVDDGWQSKDIAKAGFDAARLCALLARATSGEANLHGIIVERQGHLVAETYRDGPDRGVYGLISWPAKFGPTVVHDTRSVSKSIVSLLLGIAREQGKLTNLAAPVLDFYPELADVATSERKAVTLQHLLTMTGGLEWSESGGIPNDETSLFWKSSHARYVLERAQVAAPGSRFNYNSGGTAVLADLLVRETKVPLRDFARTNLFEPLGIVDWEWVGDVHSRPLAFTGVRMRPRDMTKIGRMVLDHGQWRGRQIVPAAWIDESMLPRTKTDFDGLQYGYQWWLGSADWHGREVRWSAAFGNGAQRIFVVPELDMTVVITAGAYGDVATARYVNALLRDIVGTVRQ